MSNTPALERHKQRPPGGVPIYQPRHLHRFEPVPLVLVPSQCIHCWGWYDDPRHR